MGLMKLSTYYKRLGDHVTFFKGDLIDLVLDDTFEMLKEQLYANDNTVFWEQYKPQICQYIKKGTKSSLNGVPKVEENPIIEALFKFYRSARMEAIIPPTITPSLVLQSRFAKLIVSIVMFQ